MRLTERLLGFTLLGSEWVLWLLIMLSIVSVAVMVERALYLRGQGTDIESLGKQLIQLLRKGDLTAARLALQSRRSPEARVALMGLEQFPRGSAAVSEALSSGKAQVKIDLERNLGVLGTLGNNAPFIGLFGTVLGIMKAFSDLSRNQGGGAGVVMAGISEALVATAVGLAVAIPAVIAYNGFQGRIRRALDRVDALGHIILSAMEGSAPAAAADPAQEG